MSIRTDLTLLKRAVKSGEDIKQSSGFEIQTEERMFWFALKLF